MFSRLKAKKSKFQNFRLSPLTKFSIFAGLIYFAQSTGSLGGLASQAVQFFAKEGLGWTPETLSYFMSLIAFAWFIKPLLGLISDFFPICGYRRKSYIYISNSLAVLLWWGLALLSYMGLLITFWWLVIPMIIIGLCFAFTDIAADGLSVQKGNENEKAGDIQSIQWTSIYIGLLLTTVLSVWLAEFSLPDLIVNKYNVNSNGILDTAPIDIIQGVFNRISIVFLVTSIFPLINIISTRVLVEEEKSCVSKENLYSVLKSLKEALKQYKVWVLALCIFMLHFNPGIWSPLFYYIRDHLGPDGGQLPKMTYAYLSMWDKGMAIIGIVLFKYYWKRIDIKKWLYFSACAGFISTLCYLWVNSVWDLVVIATLFGTIGGFIHVAFLTIAAQNTPKGVEAVMFAGYCAIFNIANSASNAFGGWLYGIFMDNPKYIETFNFLTQYGVSEHMVALRPLLIISALFTLFTIPFITLMKLNKRGEMNW